VKMRIEKWQNSSEKYSKWKLKTVKKEIC
jgi:hypothetical protein